MLQGHNTCCDPWKLDITKSNTVLALESLFLACNVSSVYSELFRCIVYVVCHQSVNVELTTVKICRYLV